MVRVNLVAVQLRAALSDYATPETFRSRMAGMMEQAAKTVDFDLPTIVVFPETVGLWLSFVPEVYDQIRDCTTIRGALVRGIPRNFGRFAGACWRYRAIGNPLAACARGCAVLPLIRREMPIGASVLCKSWMNI